MLISRKVKLGLLENVEMLLFLERGIQGGINGVGDLRHFTANNPHLNSFDPSQKTTSGAFYDVASFYACKMQKLMSRGNYRWMMSRGDYRWNSEITVRPILETPARAITGYFVEVDLKYPQHLRDLNNGLVLAPEKRTIRSQGFHHFKVFRRYTQQNYQVD